jgi:hypothetical protein
LGIDAFAAGKPVGPAMPLRPMRVGLVDHYGGLISSGWTSWLLEKFEFPYRKVYAKRLDEGHLEKDFDVLLLTDGALPAKGAWGESHPARQPEASDTPAQWQPMLGHVTDEKTLPALKAFALQGGALIALGSSTRLVQALDTPLRPALARTVDGQDKMLEKKAFYIPGSILRARVDPRQPLAYGVPDKVDVFYNQAQTFIYDDAATGIDKAAWFDGRATLRSGWAVGQEKLAGTTAIAQVVVGKGRLVAMAPEVAQRAQSYGTFKFLFNALQENPAVGPVVKSHH